MTVIGGQAMTKTDNNDIDHEALKELLEVFKRMNLPTQRALTRRLREFVRKELGR